MAMFCLPESIVAFLALEGQEIEFLAHLDRAVLT